MGKILSFLSVLLLFSGPSLGAELIVGFSYAKPPYVFAQTPKQLGETRGIEMDIMRKALGHSGHTFKPRFFSYDKLHEALAAGHIDVAATVRPESEHNYYSDEFVYFHNFAITSKAENFKIKTIADLKARTLSAWEGASKDLGVEYEKVTKTALRYREYGDQQIQAMVFLEGRVNTLIIDGAIFMYWARIFGKNIDKYAYQDIFGGRTSFVAAFKSKKLRDDFNLGLRKIKGSGEYQKIYDSYITN